MANTTVYKTTARALLNNGTDMDGNTLTVPISMGNMSETYFQANKSTACDKLISVITLLEPCLNKAVEGADLISYESIAIN